MADEQREAQCSSCLKIVPTSDNLAFLERTGEGTKAATESCANCGYHEIAHSYDGNYAPPSNKKNPHLCLNFDPPMEFVPHGPWPYDRFYCGCRGWD